MPNVTWFDPTGAMHVVGFATYDEAYSYEAALDASDVSDVSAGVDDPEWDLYMDMQAAEACDAMEAMFLHEETTHQAHVRCAEAHYWQKDHASHVTVFYDQTIPF